MGYNLYVTPQAFQIGEQSSTDLAGRPAVNDKWGTLLQYTTEEDMS